MDGSNLILQIDTEVMRTLIRSNLSCHMNKSLTPELVAQLTQQIIDAMNYILNKEGIK